MASSTPFMDALDSVGIDITPVSFATQAMFDGFATDMVSHLLKKFWIGLCNDGSGPKWADGSTNLNFKELNGANTPKVGQCILAQLNPVKWTAADMDKKLADLEMGMMMPVCY
ncbi:hypothetical protein QR680_014991 [Steinernema hermaphroditum]|uniref:Uncharacterized protein n=1 Tax=Steinernema hermaphroditum TaxID=289476 RepID=A0AA39IDB1_9BILA|nr:hypothetical protein QR680_014991 [Steinernema hermaphroditum]